MADNIGKKFEQDFKASCDEQKICVIRLKDSNKFGNGNKTRFTPKNPCDFVIYCNQNLYMIELKSTITGSISFNQPVTVQEKDKPKPDIKSAQVKDLMDYSQYPYVFCGILFRFEDRNTHDGSTYFVEVNTFVNWTTTTNKKSINESDAKSIGIPVSSRILRTNKRYDITQMTKDIDKMYIK